MSCSEFDIKSLFLGETAGEERRRTEQHLKACPACQEELDRLRLMQAALHALPDEEMPRRIAFVADQEEARPWWRRWGQAGPQLAFASAAMLSLALLVHGFLVRPVPGTTVAGQQVDVKNIEARVGAEVERRLTPAIQAAVARSQEQNAREFQNVLARTKKDLEFQRASDRVAMEEAFTLLQKRMNVRYMASAAGIGERQ